MRHFSIALHYCRNEKVEEDQICAYNNYRQDGQVDVSNDIIHFNINALQEFVLVEEPKRVKGIFKKEFEGFRINSKALRGISMVDIIDDFVGVSKG